MIISLPKTSIKQLTKNFNAQEMKCKCRNPDCKITYVDMDHIQKLQAKRDEWGVPIRINSGFRCTKHNAKMGGKKGSYHLLGKATDIRVYGWSVDKLAKMCEDFDGLGIYEKKGFAHVDSRGHRSRWKG